jgi:hypothetical protein
MKMSKQLLTVVLSVFVGVTVAEAKFPNPFSKNKPSNEPSIDLAGGQEAIVTNFAGTMSVMTESQALLLKAFGLKDEAAALELESEQLAGECDEDCLEEVVKVSKSANDAILENTDKQGQLEEEGKEYYKQGALKYAEATVLRGVPLSKQILDWGEVATDQISGNPIKAISMKRELETGLFLFKNMPSLLSIWKDSSSRLVSYGKQQGLDMSGADDFDFGD